MNEVDDRLAGDPVWELFAQPTPRPADEGHRNHSYGRWLVAAGLIALGWLEFPPLALVTVCLLFSARDFSKGREHSRSIPSKAGGTICSRFSYVWGAWKFGASALALLFPAVAIFGPMNEGPEALTALMTLVLVGIGGFTASAALTASGLQAAYRSGICVWIGEGVNRARTLFLGMLLVLFTFAVLGPMCIWLTGALARAKETRPDAIPAMLFLFVCWFAGPVVILLVLDWISRRVIADRPDKFGPKVPTLGKLTQKE